MTHGDKAKAKAGKTSQASGSKSSKAVAESKAGENGKSSKAGQGGKSGKGVAEGKAGSKVSIKKAGPEKAGAAKSGAAKRGSGGESAPETKADAKAAGKGRVAGEASVGFSNPVVADAFRRALAKYPNAFRKLTD